MEELSKPLDTEELERKWKRMLNLTREEMVGLRLRSEGGGGERKVRLRVCGKVKDMEDM